MLGFSEENTPGGYSLLKMIAPLLPWLHQFHHYPNLLRNQHVTKNHPKIELGHKMHSISILQCVRDISVCDASKPVLRIQRVCYCANHRVDLTFTQYNLCCEIDSRESGSSLIPSNWKSKNQTPSPIYRCSFNFMRMERLWTVTSEWDLDLDFLFTFWGAVML